MADFIDEIKEDLKREKHEKLFKQYGKYIASAIVLVVLGTASVTWYADWILKMEEQTGGKFYNAIMAIKKPADDRTTIQDNTTESAEPEPQELEITEQTPLSTTPETVESQQTTIPTEAERLFGEIIENGTLGYKELAGLQKAGLLLEKGNVYGAVAAYNAVSIDKNVDISVRDLASLLIAHTLMENKSIEFLDEDVSIENRLLKISGKGRPWSNSAKELLAMHYYETGEQKKTLDILSKLAEDITTPPAMRDRASSMVKLLHEINVQ